jgi:hypothetical protein
MEKKQTGSRTKVTNAAPGDQDQVARAAEGALAKAKRRVDVDYQQGEARDIRRTRPVVRAK